jgi:RHS repeat-associated protein
VTADDHFTYDVFDRRIGKLTNDGTQRWTVYSGGNPYMDYIGSTLTNRYLYANGPDELVCRTDANGNTTAWYLTDRTGSVRLIVNAPGTGLYAANYYSFGGIATDSGTGGDRFKYTGREWDAEVGLYFNRARYYDPSTARFMSQDPLQLGAGDINLYRYAFNEPPNASDPSGLTSLIGLWQYPGLAAELGIASGAGAGVGVGIGIAVGGGTAAKLGAAALASYACYNAYHRLITNAGDDGWAPGPPSGLRFVKSFLSEPSEPS